MTFFTPVLEESHKTLDARSNDPFWIDLFANSLPENYADLRRQILELRTELPSLRREPSSPPEEYTAVGSYIQNWLATYRQLCQPFSAAGENLSEEVSYFLHDNLDDLGDRTSAKIIGNTQAIKTALQNYNSIGSDTFLPGFLHAALEAALPSENATQGVPALDNALFDSLRTMCLNLFRCKECDISVGDYREGMSGGEYTTYVWSKYLLAKLTSTLEIYAYWLSKSISAGCSLSTIESQGAQEFLAIFLLENPHLDEVGAPLEDAIVAFSRAVLTVANTEIRTGQYPVNYYHPKRSGPLTWALGRTIYYDRGLPHWEVIDFPKEVREWGRCERHIEQITLFKGVGSQYAKILCNPQLFSTEWARNRRPFFGCSGFGSYIKGLISGKDFPQAAPLLTFLSILWGRGKLELMRGVQRSMATAPPPEATTLSRRLLPTLPGPIRATLSNSDFSAAVGGVRVEAEKVPAVQVIPGFPDTCIVLSIHHRGTVKVPVFMGISELLTPCFLIPASPATMDYVLKMYGQPMNDQLTRYGWVADLFKDMRSTKAQKGIGWFSLRFSYGNAHFTEPDMVDIRPYVNHRATDDLPPEDVFLRYHFAIDGRGSAKLQFTKNMMKGFIDDVENTK